MPPPPAEPFAARIFLGPALRAQPDRRLVKLVREGYEAAFEEIVRRYRKPLDRFAAAIVGGRSEDVTQDAFSKALLALRGTTTEIELRPWLYRIVRNTALNEIRDSPPPTEELGEAIPGGRSAAVEAERREEIGELMGRLRALPEPQRAAIVMRELEGLSHEEIAAALGVSGSAARQAIYRARVSLRDGLGLLIPLPLLRVLFDHGAEVAGASAGGAAAAGAATAAGGGGATLSGLGAGAVLKVGVATALLAGSVGAGVAIHHDRGGGGPDPASASAAGLPGGGEPGITRPVATTSDPPGPGRDGDNHVGKGSGASGPGPGSGRHDGNRGPSSEAPDGGGTSHSNDSSHGGGSGTGGSPGHGSRGSNGGGHSGSGDDSDDHAGEGASGGSQSGRHGSGGGDDAGRSDGSGSGGSDSGDSSGSDPGGGSDGGSGDDGTSGGGDTAPVLTQPAPELPAADDDGGSGGSSSGGDSGTSGSGDVIGGS